MVLGLEPSADNLLSVECLLKVSLDSLDSLRVGLRRSSSSLFLLDRVGSLTQFPSVPYFFLVIYPLGIRDGNRKSLSLSYANLALLKAILEPNCFLHAVKRYSRVPIRRGVLNKCSGLPLCLCHVLNKSSGSQD